MGGHQREYNQLYTILSCAVQEYRVTGNKPFEGLYNTCFPNAILTIKILPNRTDFDI